ncbi:MGDG synthase family glycosyltransferase [Thermodesulfobacteriota bacterium B35]
MSDTGGGHRASAQAIEEAIEFLYPGRYQTIIEDVWSRHMPWPIRLMPDTYGWITGPGRPLWAMLWKLTSCRSLQTAMFGAFSPMVQSSVARYIRSVQPDLCVSVHPLMNHLGLKWIEHAGLSIPFITVVTDMVSLHPSWICPGVDRCLVSTEEAKKRAILYGMPPEKIGVHGQPVGLKFTRLDGDKNKYKSLLGLDPDRPAVLLVGGGEGYGQLYGIARKLAATTNQGQLVVVAGRNRKLKKKLEQVCWQIPTKIFGFVDNMPELMAAADVLITKAGPGTISEAFVAGLPPILSGHIPGQETGNIHYVRKNRAGAYARSGTKIAHTVQQWLDSTHPVLEELAHNAACLARPNASIDIASDICSFL